MIINFSFRKLRYQLYLLVITKPNLAVYHIATIGIRIIL